MARTASFGTLCFLFMVQMATVTVGLDLTFDRHQFTVPRARRVCGVLTCEESIVSTTPGADQSDSTVVFKTVTNMTVFERISAGSTGIGRDKRDVLVGSVSSQSPSLNQVANSRKVDGLLEAARATLRVELVKQEDCLAEFTCQVRGLDTQGREVVRLGSIVPSPNQLGNQVSSSGFMSFMSMQLLSSLQQLITTSFKSLEKSMEDKLVQLQKDLHDQTDSFESKVDDRIIQLQKDFNARIDSFENRMEDKIDNNNNLNKLMQLDFKVSAELAQFRAEAKSDMMDSLDTMTQRIHAEHMEALGNVSERFERVLSNTSHLLTSMESEFQLLKSYNQSSLFTLRNETEEFTSPENTSRCVLSDTNVSKKSLTCYRGMGDSKNQTCPPYVIMTHDTLAREILCDTKTMGGGWIVIQRRTSADVNFYRSWNDYKKGFGDPTGNFWLGNDAIHNLTYKYPHELRIEMRVKGQDVFAQYTSFSIEAESDNYRLRLGSYFGTVGECPQGGLSYQNNKPFSTFDRDNDDNPGNCALVHHGAWWYRDCVRSNLNGLWGEKSLRGMKWVTGAGGVYPTFTELKVRRI